MVILCIYVFHSLRNIMREKCKEVTKTHNCKLSHENWFELQMKQYRKISGERGNRGREVNQKETEKGKKIQRLVKHPADPH